MAHGRPAGPASLSLVRVQSSASSCAAHMSDGLIVSEEGAVTPSDTGSAGGGAGRAAGEWSQRRVSPFPRRCPSTARGPSTPPSSR